MKNTQDDLDRITDLLAHLVYHYPDIETNCDVEPINAGFAFPTFKLSTPHNVLFLKYLKGLDDTELQKTEDIFQELDEANFPTCFPIKNTEGRFLSNIDEDRILLFPFVKMEEPEITSETLRTIGRFLGRLHTAKFTDRLNKYIATSDLGYFFKEYDALERSGLGASFSHIDLIRDLPATLPSGFIHSDLAFDNLLSTKDEVNGFIDFEESGYGPYLLDLTEAIVQMCFSREDFLEDMKDFLAGYKVERSLTEEEIQYFYNGLFFGCMVRNLWWAKQSDSLEKSKRISKRLDIASLVEKTGQEKITSIVNGVFT